MQHRSRGKTAVTRPGTEREEWDESRREAAEFEAEMRSNVSIFVGFGVLFLATITLGIAIFLEGNPLMALAFLLAALVSLAVVLARIRWLKRWANWPPTMPWSRPSNK